MSKYTQSNLVWIENRGCFIPNIVLPHGWKAGIKKFYEKGGREKLEKDTERFSNSLESIFGGKPELKLRWDEEIGLDGISLSVQQGIYFEEGNWREHNLGTKSSLISLGIILNYYKELSKYIIE